MGTLAVKGGIGDFLQCLPYMMAYPEHEYFVVSHYDRATEFFASVGVRVTEAPLGKVGGVELCPRSMFFDHNPFGRRAPLFNDGRPVVGVHLWASNYSLSIERRFGFPSKTLPPLLLDRFRMAMPEANFILFGSSSEIDEFSGGRPRSDGCLAFVADHDVTVSLTRVEECLALVGSDSAFKTMSAMLCIPTVVWVGDYKDETRDSVFINPYVLAGVMSVFRYKDLGSGPDLTAGASFTLSRLIATLRPHKGVVVA